MFAQFCHELLAQVTVSGAMDEIFSVTGFANGIARDAVYFPAVNRTFVGDKDVLTNSDCGVAGALHDTENFRVRTRHALTEIAPAQVMS